MQQTSSKKAVRLLASAAVIGAFAVPAMAQTNVQVEGLVDVFAGSMKFSGDAASKKVVNSGGMTTSYFGFLGSEDLGGGLKANFALTSFFRADAGEAGRFNGNETLFSRDANVGLSGSLGSLTLGRMQAPNLLPTFLFNPFGDSFTFSPLVVHYNVPLFNKEPRFNNTGWSSAVAGDTGWSNQIKYTTPSFGGLTANLHYQFGEAAGDSSKNNVGINLLYFSGPLSLTAFYHDVEVSNPLDISAVRSFAGLTAARQQMWMLGGAYDVNVAKLFATYAKTSHNVDFEDTTGSLGASVPMGAGKFLLAWAQTERTAFGVADSTRDTVSFGYDYALSKRSDVYAVAMNDKITGLSSGNSFGVGIRHRF
jgi:predicted porin